MDGNKDYTKMYLVPQEVYKKLQQENAINNQLDRDMHKILRMGDTPITQKWLMYRQQLTRYMNRKRNPNTNTTDIVDRSRQQTQPQAKVFDRGVQTVRQRNVTSEKKQSKGVTMAVQTDRPNDEQIFESDPVFDQEKRPQTPPTIRTAEDDYALLASPTNRRQKVYDPSVILDRTAQDVLDAELVEKEELEELRREKAKTKRPVARRRNSSSSSSDVEIIEPPLSVNPKPIKTSATSAARATRTMLKRTASTALPPVKRKTSRSQSKEQTGSGRNKRSKTDAIRWLCMP